VVHVSAVTGEGIDELRRRLIVRLTGGEELRDTPAVSNARHLGLVDEARAAVARGRDAMANGATEELVLAELLTARVALEAIVGRTSSDDLLQHIFSRFCVGK
jgi:tRNA modification GTPase